MEGITRSEEAAIFLSERDGEPLPAVYIRQGEVTTSGYEISEAVGTELIKDAWRERTVRRRGDADYMTIATPLIAEGSLHLVAGAPRMRRPAYVVYSGTPKDNGVLQQALDALRDIALDAPG